MVCKAEFFGCLYVADFLIIPKRKLKYVMKTVGCGGCYTSNVVEVPTIVLAADFLWNVCKFLPGVMA